ncbi:Xyloglucan fucosyltransferase, partial [Musa troglodytarum]
DRLLGGLLSPEFDEASCLSRDQSAQYWKQSNHTPSPYLLQKLRNYESLHRRCGPNTELYNKSIEQLKSNASTRPSECNYVVWLESGGIGNRVISMVSTFLYALLNDKVFLLKLPDDFHGIFCEPFPGTSWILYSDFPIQDLDGYSWVLEKDHGYGNLLKNKLLSSDMDTANASLPAFLYLHLVHSNDEFDKMFYCEEGQQLLRKFSWLLLRSNQYFAPAFFLVPEFETELSLLFPEKTAVFHHLGTYLFHPSNTVWGYITRYYEAYLANAKSRLGIQIRLFRRAHFDSHSDYIIDCALTKRLLPNVNLTDTALPTITGAKPRSVLVTSLRSGYFEKLRSMYYEHATTTGEVISVHQPSHEEEQHSEKLNHNMKAFAEIYLLSLSDALITSPFSTFGYVAQGLGGLRPWLLVRPDDHDLCLHSTSMEPCFHFPPSYDCKARKKVDIGSVAPYLRHCEDFPHGVRLFD